MPARRPLAVLLAVLVALHPAAGLAGGGLSDVYFDAELAKPYFEDLYLHDIERFTDEWLRLDEDVAAEVEAYLDQKYPESGPDGTAPAGCGPDTPAPAIDIVIRTDFGDIHIPFGPGQSGQAPRYPPQWGQLTMSPDLWARSIGDGMQDHYAREKGALVVAASGNDGGSTAAFGPASLRGVLAVAATTPEDEQAGFSNHGAAVDVAAPGVDVLGPRAPRTDLALGLAPPPG